MGWTVKRRLLLLTALLLLEALTWRWVSEDTLCRGRALVVRLGDLTLLVAACLVWGRAGFRWAPAGPYASLALATAWGVGILATALLFVWAMRAAGVGFGLPSFPWQPRVPWLLAFVAVGPLVEEMVFRGLLLDLCWVRGSRRTAVLVTALLFALAHGLPFRVEALACGIACGFLASGRGGILGAWILHAAGNAFLAVAPELL